MSRAIDHEILSLKKKLTDKEKEEMLIAVSSAVSCAEGGTHLAVRRISPIADEEERREILAAISCAIRMEYSRSYQKLRILSIRRISD